MLVLRWLLPALVPALLVVVLARKVDPRGEREPAWLLGITFSLGALFGLGALFLEARTSAWTGLDVRTDVAGNSGAALFVFAFVAPTREVAKVAAMWPAFRSKHFNQPTDGIVYAACSALGFASLDVGHALYTHPTGAIWLARAAVSLPAHVFFACAWGYALGRAKRNKRPTAIFPAAWVAATLTHGLYTHLVYGRGQAAIFGVIPLLLAMGAVTFFATRDLKAREEAHAEARDSVMLERPSVERMSAPPSLRTVREALRREGQPITIRWILFGALVTIGAMFAGLALAIAFGHWARVDFSVVDERDVSTAGPVALLGAGLLSAFPLSGYLIAKASSLPTLLEPALAAALAITATLALLGFAAPIALVFALAFSPIAWGLSCAGAWVGRPPR